LADSSHRKAEAPNQQALLPNAVLYRQRSSRAHQKSLSECAGDNCSGFLNTYYNKTKDTLNTAKALQKRVNAQGFEEDGIDEKMARAHELDDSLSLA
jgi:hypothetical protein